MSGDNQKNDKTRGKKKDSSSENQRQATKKKDSTTRKAAPGTRQASVRATRAKGSQSAVSEQVAVIASSRGQLPQSRGPKQFQRSHELLVAINNLRHYPAHRLRTLDSAGAVSSTNPEQFVARLKQSLAQSGKRAVISDLAETPPPMSETRSKPASERKSGGRRNRKEGTTTELLAGAPVQEPLSAECIVPAVGDQFMQVDDSISGAEGTALDTVGEPLPSVVPLPAGDSELPAPGYDCEAEGVADRVADVVAHLPGVDATAVPDSAANLHEIRSSAAIDLTKVAEASPVADFAGADWTNTISQVDRAQAEDPATNEAVVTGETSVGYRPDISYSDDGLITSVSWSNTGKSAHFDYGRDSAGKSYVRQAILPDGTILTSNDGVQFQDTGTGETFEGFIEFAEDGAFEISHPKGSYIYETDGSMLYTEPSGAYYVSEGGLIRECVYAGEIEELRFFYDDHEQLVRVDRNGSGKQRIFELHDGQWFMQLASCAVPCETVALETDGSLAYSVFGRQYKASMDGAIVATENGAPQTLRDAGSITAESRAIEEANSRKLEPSLPAFLSYIRQYVPNQHTLELIAADVESLRERVCFGHLSADDANEFVEVISLLVRPETGGQLEHALRCRVACELLALASNPQRVMWQRQSNCNTAVCELRVFSAQPAIAARIVRDICVDGELVCADKTVLRPFHYAGKLQLKETLVPDGTNQNRLLGSRVFRATMLAAVYSAMDRIPVTDELVGHGNLTLNEDDLLIDVRQNPPAIIKDADGKPLKFNGLSSTHYQKAYSKVTGRDDSVIIAEGRSLDEFRTELLERSERNEWPVAIMVHTFNEPFFTELGFGAAVDTLGWHVAAIGGVEIGRLPDDSGNGDGHDAPEIQVVLHNTWSTVPGDCSLHRIPLRSMHVTQFGPLTSEVLEELGHYSQQHPEDAGARVEVIRRKLWFTDCRDAASRAIFRAQANNAQINPQWTYLRDNIEVSDCILREDALHELQQILTEQSSGYESWIQRKDDTSSVAHREMAVHLRFALEKSRAVLDIAQKMEWARSRAFKMLNVVLEPGPRSVRRNALRRDYVKLKRAWEGKEFTFDFASLESEDAELNETDVAEVGLQTTEIPAESISIAATTQDPVVKQPAAAVDQAVPESEPGDPAAVSVAGESEVVLSSADRQPGETTQEQVDLIELEQAESAQSEFDLFEREYYETPDSPELAPAETPVVSLSNTGRLVSGELPQVIPPHSPVIDYVASSQQTAGGTEYVSVIEQTPVVPPPARIESLLPGGGSAATVQSTSENAPETAAADVMEKSIQFEHELQSFCEQLPGLLASNEALRSRLMTTMDQFTERVLMGELAHEEATETLRAVNGLLRAHGNWKIPIEVRQHLVEEILWFTSRPERVLQAKPVLTGANFAEMRMYVHHPVDAAFIVEQICRDGQFVCPSGRILRPFHVAGQFHFPRVEELMSKIRSPGSGGDRRILASSMMVQHALIASYLFDLESLPGHGEIRVKRGTVHVNERQQFIDASSGQLIIDSAGNAIPFVALMASDYSAAYRDVSGRDEILHIHRHIAADEHSLFQELRRRAEAQDFPVIMPVCLANEPFFSGTDCSATPDSSRTVAVLGIKIQIDRTDPRSRQEAGNVPRVDEVWVNIDTTWLMNPGQQPSYWIRLRDLSRAARSPFDPSIIDELKARVQQQPTDIDARVELLRKLVDYTFARDYAEKRFLEAIASGRADTAQRAKDAIISLTTDYCIDRKSAAKELERILDIYQEQGANPQREAEARFRMKISALADHITKNTDLGRSLGFAGRSQQSTGDSIRREPVSVKGFAVNNDTPANIMPKVVANHIAAHGLPVAASAAVTPAGLGSHVGLQEHSSPTELALQGLSGPVLRTGMPTTDDPPAKLDQSEVITREFARYETSPAETSASLDADPVTLEMESDVTTGEIPQLPATAFDVAQLDLSDSDAAVNVDHRELVENEPVVEHHKTVGSPEEPAVDKLATQNERLAEHDMSDEHEPTAEHGLSAENEAMTAHGLSAENEAMTEHGLSAENEAMTEHGLSAENEAIAEHDSALESESIAEHVLVTENESIVELGSAAENESKAGHNWSADPDIIAAQPTADSNSEESTAAHSRSALEQITSSESILSLRNKAREAARSRDHAPESPNVYRRARSMRSFFKEELPEIAEVVSNEKGETSIIIDFSTLPRGRMLRIGNDPGCDVIVANEHVSGKQFVLTVDAGGNPFIMDPSGSIYCNDQPIEGFTPVAPSQKITLGGPDGLRLILKIDADAALANYDRLSQEKVAAVHLRQDLLSRAQIDVSRTPDLHAHQSTEWTSLTEELTELASVGIETDFNWNELSLQSATDQNESQQSAFATMAMLEDGTFTDVWARFEYSPERLRAEMLAQEISSYLFGKVPVTIERELFDPERKALRSTHVQEHAGRPLDAFLMVKAVEIAQERHSAIPEMIEVFHEFAELRHEVAEAYIERLILGAQGYGLRHFTVQSLGKCRTVKIIGLDDLLNSQDLEGICARAQRDIATNPLLAELAGQPLPPQVLSRLYEFIAILRRPEIRERLHHNGMQATEVDAMLARAQEIAYKKTFPPFATGEDSDEDGAVPMKVSRFAIQAGLDFDDDDSPSMLPEVRSTLYQLCETPSFQRLFNGLSTSESAALRERLQFAAESLPDFGIRISLLVDCLALQEAGLERDLWKFALLPSLREQHIGTFSRGTHCLRRLSEQIALPVDKHHREFLTHFLEMELKKLHIAALSIDELSSDEWNDLELSFTTACDLCDSIPVSIDDGVHVPAIWAQRMNAFMSLLKCCARNAALFVPFARLGSLPDSNEVAVATSWYARLISESAQSSAAEQEDALKGLILSVLHQIPAEHPLKDWFFAPSQPGSPAASMDIDGAFIDMRTGELIFARLVDNIEAFNAGNSSARSWTLLVDLTAVDTYPIANQIGAYLADQQYRMQSWNVADFIDGDDASTSEGRIVFPSFHCNSVQQSVTAEIPENWQQLKSVQESTDTILKKSDPSTQNRFSILANFRSAAAQSATIQQWRAFLLRALEQQDLESLRKLPNVEILDLRSSSVRNGDVLLLAQMSGLRLLDLRQTRITPGIISVLRSRLPNCEIRI